MNNKYRKALNNIAIPLAETDFIASHIEDFKMLKELVEKERPKKPKKTEDGNFIFYRCPICNTHLPCGDNYCFECGQKIDWSDEK